MAKFLDISVEIIEESLKSVALFIRHNSFNSRPYQVRVRILLHSFFCLAVSYAIWQFFASKDEITFESTELAINILFVLSGWLGGSIVFFATLRLSNDNIKFIQVLKLYIFVHSNTVLICSLISLMVFVVSQEFATQKITLFSEVTRQILDEGQSQLMLRKTKQFTVSVIQLIFLMCGSLMLLIYQPTHFKSLVQASWFKLYGVTIAITATAVFTQIYLWQTSNDSTEVIGRVLRSPGLIPL